MKIDKRELVEGGRKALIIAVCGPIQEVEEGWELEKFLADLARTGHPVTVVDLADCSYINSAGLGALFRGYSSVTRTGRIFRLAGVGRRVADLFKITKLDSIFEVYQTAEEAATAPVHP